MSSQFPNCLKSDPLRWASVARLWGQSILARARFVWRRSVCGMALAIPLVLDVGSAYGAADPGGGGGGDGKSHALSWGLVLLCLILGLLLTLRPAHRSEEIKRPVRDND